MTGKQEKALAALVRSPTAKQAAEAAGIGYTSLRRWMREDEEFRNAYKAALAELLEDAHRQSSAGMGAALDTLREISEDILAGANARIAASRALLEFSLKLREAVDTEARLTAIEEKLMEADR